MKRIYFFSIIFCLASCSGYNSGFDEKFYLRVTRMALPPGYQVLESHDNGEYLTMTTFKVDSSVLINYIKKNKFGPVSRLSPKLLGDSYLKRVKPDYKPGDEYYVAGDREKNDWILVADIKKGILWVQILYPDWSGN